MYIGAASVFAIRKNTLLILGKSPMVIKHRKDKNDRLKEANYTSIFSLAYGALLNRLKCNNALAASPLNSVLQ